MMMIVLRLLSRLLSLLGLKSLSHRHFSPRPLKVFFEGRGRGVAGFVDSGAKTLVPSASNRSTAEWTRVDSGPETLVPSASNRSARVDSLWPPWAPATGERPGATSRQAGANLPNSQLRPGAAANSALV